MAEAKRKTILAERKEIAEYCILHDRDYAGTAAHYGADAVRTGNDVVMRKYLGLKQRAVGIAGRIRGFQFEDQLHIAMMLKMTKGEEGLVNSQFLHLEATLYIGVLSWADNTANGIVLAAFELDYMFDTEYDSQPHTFYPGRRCLSSMWRLSEDRIW